MNSFTPGYNAAFMLCGNGTLERQQVEAVGKAIDAAVAAERLRCRDIADAFVIVEPAGDFEEGQDYGAMEIERYIVDGAPASEAQVACGKAEAAE